MKVNRFESKYVDTMPDEYEEGMIYISLMYETAIHLCACGCKEKTVTPLNKEYGWDLKDDHGLVTLTPSIGNFNTTCKSHYFITQNEVRWCR